MTPPSNTPVDFPFRVFLKVFVAAFIVYATLKAAPLLLLFLLAVLIATTLYPLQEWLVKKHVPRALAFLLIAVFTLGIFGAFLFGLLPKVVEQFGTLPAHFARVSKELSEKVSNETLRAKIEAGLKDPPKLLGNVSERLLALSTTVMGGLFNIGLMLVISLYLLADGRKSYLWVRAFFSPPNQRKLDATTDQVAEIISAYVAGQLITSALVAVYVFGLLTITRVPAALSLAILAAVFDILPMIGFLVALAFAVILAITVSGSTALVVAIAFIAYHFLENYVIVPRIYGNRMRLSGLVVLLSLVFSVEIGGVIAGILVLPFIAAYPIIEKIWLPGVLGARTLGEHTELEESSDKKES